MPIHGRDSAHIFSVKLSPSKFISATLVLNIIKSWPKKIIIDNGKLVTPRKG